MSKIFRKNKIIIFLALLLIIALVTFIGIQLYSRDPVIGIIYSDTYAKKYGLNVKDAVDNLISQDLIDNDNILVKVNTGNMQSIFDSIENLAEMKCNIIVVICENNIDAVEQVATEYNKINFCVFGAEKQNGNIYSNIRGFNFAVHELRYVNGYLAGLKLKEMASNDQIDKEKQIIGYIADEENSGNISAYSAMYLGAKAANEDIKFYVKYIDDESSYDGTSKALISNGCNLIGLQSSNETVRTVCDENNILYYELGDVPDNELLMSLTECRLESYISYLIDCKRDKVEIADGWCGGFKDDSLSITFLENDIFYDRDKIQTKTDELISRFSDSSLKVFDTSTWTVSGEKIETTLSDDGSGIEYIKMGGYFAEGDISPNPQFTFNIDGITILK